MGTLDAINNAPFAPFYSPSYWITGGQASTKSQTPTYLASQGAGSGGGAPSGGGTQRTGTDPNKTYVQGTSTGARRQSAPAPGMGGGNAYQGTGAGPWTSRAMTPANPAGAQGATPASGTESGPGILESWFNQRAAGTDPAYEYAMKRGMQSLGTQSAAAGNFNSGAARQQESDFAANMGAQRMGQLDALAGGASGEHAGRLAQMFGTGNQLAGGQAGTMGAYDLASANANNAAMQALMQIYGNKAGVDAQSNKQGFGNLIGLASAF